MAFLTNISGMPLFSTVSEALEWGASNSILKGYHTHRWKNRIGYMAGHTHGQAVSPTAQMLLQPPAQALLQSTASITPTITTTTTTTTTTPPTAPPTGGGGGY